MGKTLILAEKPSVGKDIARVLGVTGRGDGLIDGVLPEDARLFPELDRALAETLGALEKQKEEELLKNRYRRYRRLDGLYRSHGA